MVPSRCPDTAVGFTEEVATRGIAVTILRDSGMKEIGVAVIALFLIRGRVADGIRPATEGVA